MTKERILFFLRRHRNQLEQDASFSHQSAAKSGVPYERRRALMEEAEKRFDEYDAIAAAVRIIELHDGEIP